MNALSSAPAQNIQLTPEAHERLCAALDAFAHPDLKATAESFRKQSVDRIQPAELTDLLEQVIAIAQEQYIRVGREKELLFAQVEKHLDEISAFLVGERADRDATAEESTTLTIRLSSEVEQLKQSFSGQAPQSGLRSYVDQRLASIQTHLRTFREQQESRARMFEERAQQLSVRVQELEREAHLLHHDLDEKRRLAMTDSLTGIANRTTYHQRMQGEYLQWKQSARPLSILVWDIDHFKKINDAYGHKAGDRVLRAVAQLLARRIRGSDLVARYGGEEFAMLLIGAGPEEALEVAEQLRTDIAQLRFLFREVRVEVTVSCGIASFLDDDTPSKVFDRADKALYRAKGNGRNRCVLDLPHTGR